MSKLSPFSFLDQRGIDRLTRASINIKPGKKDWMSNSDKLYNPYTNIKSFEDIVEAATNGLTVHHLVTPATLKTFKEVSNLELQCENSH